MAALGEVLEVERSADGVRLTVTTELAAELREGDSVAVDGVCLTATAVDRTSFQADVVNETLRRSSLAEIAIGRQVNLELPVRPSDRLGGHIVQGHVDGVGQVIAVGDDGRSRRLTIAPPSELLRYVAPKGSIAVDGVSLTVAELESGSFTVSLIPETLARTSLGRAESGANVNLEVDVLAKYVERLIDK